MKKLLANIKFNVGYYYRNVLGYLSNVASALIGRTGKQARYLEDLIESTLSAVARLSLENEKLRRKITELEAKPKALKKIAEDKPKVSKKAARPKKGQ